MRSTPGSTTTAPDRPHCSTWRPPSADRRTSATGSASPGGAAEELGLIGSEQWVASQTFDQKLDIALNLNFDMVDSPNAAYFVYDGDNSDAEGAGAGPYGSAQIEQTFVDFFGDRLGIETEGTDFSGRSDYGAFIANGIP